MKIAFHASPKPRPQEALEVLSKGHDNHSPAEADVIVVMGGDGTMLRALHKYQHIDTPLFGVNLGTLGFLLNTYERGEDLVQRIENAVAFTIRPLEMNAMDQNGRTHTEVGFNEVSLLREMHNSAKIKVSVNGKVRLEELVCDGIMVSTTVGSTAYNLSAGGPILPLDSNLLPITAISPFRPRRWKGALIRNNSEIRFDILKAADRPVSATADAKEVRDVQAVTITQSKNIQKTLLFDSDSPLEERIFKEQFAS